MSKKQDEQWLKPKPQVVSGVFQFQPIPDDQKRSVIMASTFTKSQADAIKSYAHSQGMTHSELMRLAVYNYLKERDALNTTEQVDANQTSIWDTL